MIEFKGSQHFQFLHISTSWKHGGGQIRSAGGGGGAATTYDNVVLILYHLRTGPTGRVARAFSPNPLTAPLTQGCGTASREKCYDGAGSRKAWSGRKRRMRCRKARGGIRLAIAGYERVMEGTDMRASVLTLAAGECVPWHYHSTIIDSFVCLEGPMEVETFGRRAQCTALPPGNAARWRRRLRTRCTGWMVDLAGSC